MELYIKYRPSTTDEIVGNDLAIKSIRSEIAKEHHVFLLTGESGTGKTTLARAIANELGGNELSIHEINSSENRGIDTIREIMEQIRYQPLDGKLIYILDEMHQQTTASQNAMLKMLEDCPSYAYFFLATTDKDKVIPAVKTRCSCIEMKPLNHDTMFMLLRKVAHKEQVQISQDVLHKIADLSNGSSRNGLKILGQVLYLENDEQRTEYLDKNTFNEENPDVFKLCGALFRKTGWQSYMDCMEKAKDDIKANPESIRFMIMSYARTVLKKGFNLNAAAMIKAFCGVDTFRNKEYAIIDGIISYMELTGE